MTWTDHEVVRNSKCQRFRVGFSDMSCDMSKCCPCERVTTREGTVNALWYRFSKVTLHSIHQIATSLPPKNNGSYLKFQMVVWTTLRNIFDSHDVGSDIEVSVTDVLNKFHQHTDSKKHASSRPLQCVLVLVCHLKMWSMFWIRFVFKNDGLRK